MSTPPTPAAFFSNEALKKCILSKAECEVFKKNATFVGVYSHEDGRILVDSKNDLRTQLTELHKILSDLWAHVAEHERPSAVFCPTLSQDGNAWIALLGEDLQVGCVGCGDTPDAAMRAFDKEWYKSASQSPTP